MTRRKESLFDLIASVPWPVGLVLGILGYVGVRYGIGWYLASNSNQVLAGLGKTAQGGAFVPFAWLLLGICWLAALFSFLGRGRRTLLLEAQISLDSLRAMSWREFEMLVGEAFRRQGYRIEETGLGGADGGVDLHLSKDGKKTLVQCKQWRTQSVDVKVVREMYGLLAHYHAHEVKIVAVGDFTPDAQQFAQDKPIELIHGDALLALVLSVQVAKPARRPRLFNQVLTAGAAPPCPKCGRQMVRRMSRRSHHAFWGCSRYPFCRGTRSD